MKIEDKAGKDLYPEIKRRSLSGEYTEKMAWDLVRHDIMHRFGYYNTESSEHTAEYNPYYIKARYPELIERFKIPLDEYPRRCVNQIAGWKELREKVTAHTVEHEISHEFGMPIINAYINDSAYRIHGNVLNTGLITNLPENACVEVPCLIDGNGVNPCFVGELPEQCAALNRTNINVQNMTIEAAKQRKRNSSTWRRISIRILRRSFRSTTSKISATICSPPTRIGCRNIIKSVINADRPFCRAFFKKSKVLPCFFLAFAGAC